MSSTTSMTFMGTIQPSGIKISRIMVLYSVTQMLYQHKEPPSTTALVSSMGLSDPFQDLMNVRELFIMVTKGSMH